MSANTPEPDAGEWEAQEYAVVIACLLAGRCDGQQAVASIAALAERFRAAHVARVAEEAKAEALRGAALDFEGPVRSVGTIDGMRVVRLIDVRRWLQNEAIRTRTPDGGVR